MTADATPAEGRITTERRGRLFLIGIDRPKKLNGFSPEMIRALAEAYTAFERDADAWCGVLFAHGANFTAGLELDRFAPLMASGQRLVPPACIDPLDLREPRRGKPLVVAVRGICFTLGIELMLAADIVIAGDDGRFAQLEVGRGIMATGGATLRMVERAGWGNAMQYLLTGREFGAAEALRLGFVQEVVAPDAALPRALAVATEIAAQAPLAVSATLGSARLAAEQGPLAAIARFEAVQARLGATADAAEGVRSFIERRKARFTGR
jgi:enoyl-CoA hydratase/carnithine racemase